MKTSPLALALRIAQLVEEYSEKEIQDALSLLKAHGVKSSLLEFLSHRHSPYLAKLKSRPGKAHPSLDNTTSRSVLRLRDSDPDKFHLLSEFDLMVRRGQVLTTFEDLKRFGERLSKEFQPKKSRKETIGVLLSILAERSLLEIEKLIEFAASFGVAGSTDEYQRLAQFLIKGTAGESQ